MDRLFLGVAVPDEVRRDLRAWLEALEVPGRVVPPENWHLTLRFLGDTPREAAERLTAALGAVRLGGRFDVALDGLGAFPRAARATVLWLGVGEGAGALRSLAARVEEAIRPAGFEPEPRPFTPHLTLSRIQPPRDVRPTVEDASPFEGRMPVEAVVLFRSHLGRGPARYEELARFPLDPAP